MALRRRLLRTAVVGVRGSQPSEVHAAVAVLPCGQLGELPLEQVDGSLGLPQLQPNVARWSSRYTPVQ
jgi:hypothetical protein